MQTVCLERHGLVRFSLDWVYVALPLVMIRRSGPERRWPKAAANPAEDGQHLALAIFYPAAPPDSALAPFRMTFFSNLHLNVELPIVADELKRPLIMFSHGAGSNGLYYSWFGEYLASHGYLRYALSLSVKPYDPTVMYTRSKLWQRPRDIMNLP